MRYPFFKTLWGIYCVSVLALLIIIARILILLGKIIPGVNIKHWPDFFCMHFILPLFFFFSLIRVKVIGKENIQSDHQYVIVSNHTTYLDILVNIHAYRRPFRFLSKSENAKIPLAGFFIKSLTILVDRDNETSRKQSFRQMSTALQQGYSILIYPEGTRYSGKDLLGKFQSGAFRLALQNQVPIVPMTIHNASNIADPKYFISFLPGTITCVYGIPVSTNEMSLNDEEKLKNLIRSKMLAQIKQFQKSD